MPSSCCVCAGDLESDAQRARRRSSLAAAAPVACDDGDFKLLFRIGNADFDLAAAWARDFDLAAGSVVALDSDSVFVECKGVIRRLAMLLLAGWGCSLIAEKKARWRGHWIVCDAAAPAVGLLWKPSAGCGTGDVELPDKYSGAS